MTSNPEACLNIRQFFDTSAQAHTFPIHPRALDTGVEDLTKQVMRSSTLHGRKGRVKRVKGQVCPGRPSVMRCDLKGSESCLARRPNVTNAQGKHFTCASLDQGSNAAGGFGDGFKTAAIAILAMGGGCEQRRSNRILPLPSSAALPLIQLEMHRMATPPMRFEIP